ncbi:hypothetical protein MXD61_22575 [Frankia sp. AgPm24]|uniref:hypothetical protein n=1 Tax=Frankia sp. AgPm24 TaxID=631128 RepID=UPI00200E8703|nr:hypothetical protein [Frankia sp. AgPm24]MCK9924614.1 hypothetical protein [Frankia sp. AgPm24]
MSTPRLLDQPLVLDLLRRLSAAGGGAVLLCYGLVHLLVWPGAPTGTPGERYRWNGDTHLFGWLPAAVGWTLGAVLLAATVLGYVAAAAGLVGVPVLRRHHLGATATGCTASLGLYAVAWPGLEPDPTDFSAGPVISGLLLACVLATTWARRYPSSTGGGSPRPPANRGSTRTRPDATADRTAPTFTDRWDGTTPWDEAAPWDGTEPWDRAVPRPGAQPRPVSEPRVVRPSSSRSRLSRADGSHRRRAHPVE